MMHFPESFPVSLVYLKETESRTNTWMIFATSNVSENWQLLLRIFKPRAEDNVGIAGNLRGDKTWCSALSSILPSWKPANNSCSPKLSLWPQESWTHMFLMSLSNGRTIFIGKTRRFAACLSKTIWQELISAGVLRVSESISTRKHSPVRLPIRYL